jgi:hydroxypyruvate isomerase
MPPVNNRHVTFLIEPLNHYDAPGYFLNSTEQARRIIEAVAAPNLKLMFDCYHIQILEGDLTRRLQANIDIIGHIQFAGVPSRGRPDQRRD